jgi:hypothetical protein
LYVFHPSLLLLDFIYFFEDFFEGIFCSVRRLIKSENLNEEDTYGSFTFYSLFVLKQRLNIESGSTICDLGSGKGKICLFFSLLNQNKCIGLEKNTYYNTVHRFLMTLFFQGKRIKIIEADFLKTTLPDCQILFVPTTCMSQDSILSLCDIINELPGTPVIISSSSPLPLEQYKVYQKIRLTQSWGLSWVYVQIAA